MMKVIYIMGLGRSGSTLLDLVLGNHSSIESVGELRNLPLLGWMKPGICSCGATAGDCDYWQNVRALWTAKIGAGKIERLIELQDRYERIRSFPRLVRNRLQTSFAFREYGEMVSALYQAIQQVSGKSMIVDSTKYPARAYALLQTREIDLYLVHLVRDGRAVIWSCIRKPNTNPDGSALHIDAVELARRTSLHWLRVNLACDVLLSLPSTRGVRVRYEDLVEKPSDALVPIGNMMGLDMAHLARDLASGEEMRVGHMIAGNRVRMSGAVRLKPDLEWKEKLCAEERQVFWKRAGWLARRYGFDNQPRTGHHRTRAPE